MQILKITDLTLGELLELDRLRLKETQAQYAERLQVSEQTVYNWESGRINSKQQETIEKKRFKLAKHLTLQRQCYFARKRFGETQGQVAKALGFSRYWILLMEQGTVPIDQKMLEYYSPKK